MKKAARKISKQSKTTAKSAKNNNPAAPPAAAPHAGPTQSERARQRVAASRRAAINKVIFQPAG